MRKVWKVMKGPSNLICEVQRFNQWIFLTRKFFTSQNKYKWFNQTTLEQVGNCGK
jgi:hypothetical protein